MENLDIQPTTKREVNNLSAIKRSLLLPVIFSTILFGIAGFSALINFDLISSELIIQFNQFTQTTYFSFFFLICLMLNMCAAITLKDFSKITKNSYKNNCGDYLQLGFYLLSIIYSILFIANIISIENNIILGYELPKRTLGILRVGSEILSVIAWSVMMIGFIKLIKLRFSNLISRIALIIAIVGSSMTLLYALFRIMFLSSLYFSIDIIGNNFYTIYYISSAICFISIPLLFIAIPMFHGSLKCNTPKAPKIQKNSAEKEELDDLSLDLDKF